MIWQMEFRMNSPSLFWNEIVNPPWDTLFLLLKSNHLLSCILKFMRRRSWRNGYYCRIWTQRPEFKFWTRLFVFDILLIFLSLRVFGLLSSSLLLFPQRFGRYVLRPSSGVCRTREPSWNFELRPLLNPNPVLIPLAITGYKN